MNDTDACTVRGEKKICGYQLLGITDKKARTQYINVAVINVTSTLTGIRTGYNGTEATTYDGRHSSGGDSISVQQIHCIDINGGDVGLRHNGGHIGSAHDEAARELNERTGVGHGGQSGIVAGGLRACVVAGHMPHDHNVHNGAVVVRGVDKLQTAEGDVGLLGAEVGGRRLQVSIERKRRK